MKGESDARSRMGEQHVLVGDKPSQSAKVHPPGHHAYPTPTNSLFRTLHTTPPGCRAYTAKKKKKNTYLSRYYSFKIINEND